MEALGINALGLIGQIVNFGIVFFLLKKFLFGPVGKMIAERQQTIEDSLKKVEEVDARANSIEEERKAVLKKAEEDSKAIIKEANQKAAKVRDEIIAQAQSEAEDIKTAAKESIEEERKQILSSMQKTVAKLSVQAAEQILDRSIDTKIQQELIEKDISRLSASLAKEGNA